MNIKQFYDKVFGNNDGKFTMADLPNKSVLIVGVVVDLVVLFAEYRVYMVGYALTGSVMLALGFVLVSSLPFYLGQLAWLYNRANNWQQGIAISMVVMGIGVSAYYGFADFLLANTIAVTNAVSISMNTNTLFGVAIAGTALLIIGGLFYVVMDDDIANRVKANRIEGKVKTAKHEVQMKRELLAEMKALAQDEEQLRAVFGDHYDELTKQFINAAGKANKENPTHGNGNTR